MRPGENHDRTRIPIAGHARLQPHSADRRSLRRPRNAALAVPEAGADPARRQEHLPAGIGGRRRALRPLLLHRPAGLHAAAQLRQPHRSGEARRSGRDAPKAIRSNSSRIPGPLQGRASVPACRAFAAAWPATSATTRCATSRSGWHIGAAGRPRPARHPVAGDRGTGGDRQPVRQAVPDRVRRSDPAGSLHQSAPAPAGLARHAAAHGRCAGDVGFGAHRQRARIRERGLPEGGGARQGIRDGRRPDAGADRPAHQQALRRFAAVAVPRAALAESVAVHVLLQFRRHADRRRLAGNPGAQRSARRRPAQGHDPPARRHPSARRHAGTRRRSWPPNCWPTRRKSPNT